MYRASTVSSDDEIQAPISGRNKREARDATSGSPPQRPVQFREELSGFTRREGRRLGAHRVAQGDRVS